MYFGHLSSVPNRFGVVLLKSLHLLMMLFMAAGALPSCTKQKGVSASAARSSEIEVSGAINDEDPVHFTQANDSVEISGVNLTATTSYEVTAYSLLSDGLKTLVYRGNFSEPKFAFKSKVPPKFLSIEVIRQPDGARFGSVLPPISKSRSAKVIMDRTTSISLKLMTVILDQAQKGDVRARSAINDGMISVADLLVLAQSVRRTTDEQKSSKQGQAIDLKALALAIVEKSVERFEALVASGQSAVSISDKLSEASYVTIFGVAADAASPGILAYRTDPDLGPSDAAKMDVAYAAIKALTAEAVKPVDEAFRAESVAYRTAPDLVTAVASEGVVTSTYKTTFSNCLSAPNSCATSSFTPPEPSSVEGLSPPKFKVCSSNGEVGCITTSQFKAADLASLAADNIRSGITIAGVAGNLTAPVAPDPWSVRIGVTVNGVTGKLKVNCRNRVNTGVYNYDGALGSIPQTGTATGTSIDIWDTIDDSNNAATGLPPDIVKDWTSDTDCGGVEVAAGDSNVWKDVTTTVGGATSNCATDGARCTMQDKITGLWWSKLQPLAAWNIAWSNCQSLNYNGQTDWRLPTQKELMEAHAHGIRSAASANWVTEASMTSAFWSGSSSSINTNRAWLLCLANGDLYLNNSKQDIYPVVCVR